MTPGQRVSEAWHRSRPGLPVVFGAVVLGALLAAGEPATYGVSGLLVLLGLALVVPGLDRASAAVARPAARLRWWPCGCSAVGSAG